MTKEQVLKEYFGYDTFREGQAHLIDSILSGNDVVGVMPTGAGKSICFWVPAMMMEGITLVISPLISLMKDQVNTLVQSGIRGAYLNSSLNLKQQSKVLANAREGLYKIIYVAPERLLSEDFLDFVQFSNISMVVIDEAHCISQWGQDFRPSYLKILDFVESFKKRPVLSAFTATATKRVREDIISILNLKSPELLVTGFNRKNLYFEVQKPVDKFAALAAFLKDKQEKSGVIYCNTRKAVEEVCERLCGAGYLATRYHAGLSDKERLENQDDFIFDRKPIIVATNAFGMGIDKSNVSYVVHFNMPKDIESYYQEAGRAGRDGANADCILLYSGQDVRTNLFLIENSKDVEYPDAATEQMLKERERERLKVMTFYCTTNDCLREYIMRYFGENPKNFCENCSNCNTNFEIVDITLDVKKILSCIKMMNERFGVKMITDTLRGSKNERIVKLGLNEISTYGILKDVSEKRIRDIINYLILQNYLLVTNDEYPIVKLGERASESLSGDATLEMKLTKQVEVEISRKKSKSADILNPDDEQLFIRLKALRRSMAERRSVPAFVIFSDATLLDMCIKKPTTENELLNVSGVGQVKLQNYGQYFLDEIAGFLGA